MGILQLRTQPSIEGSWYQLPQLNHRPQSSGLVIHWPEYVSRKYEASVSTCGLFERFAVLVTLNRWGRETIELSHDAREDMGNGAPLFALAPSTAATGNPVLHLLCTGRTYPL